MNEGTARPTEPHHPRGARIRRLVDRGFRALARHEQPLVEESARAIVSLDPAVVEGWILLARACQQLSDFEAMLTHVEHARSLAPERVDLEIMRAEAAIANGLIAQALATLGDAAGRTQDPRLLHQVVVLYTQLGRHEPACEVAERLVASGDADAAARLAFASSAVAVGRFGEAMQQLDAVIAARPDQAEAYYTRSSLERQTADSNHVDELRARLSACAPGDAAVVPLSYALGKELEDIGEFDAAFESFRRGAEARRQRLSYDVADDVATMQDIAEIFDERWWQAAAAGDTVSGPIFVCGLPRSGTTLVDRILASHPDVASLGEINDLAYAAMRIGSPAAGKRALMTNLAAADLKTLGAAYWRAARGYGESAPNLIDKTPGNVLYLGLVAKALPAARIIHVRRHPMASGYAMYKSLFRMGYPFSYDLDSIGRYRLAHDRLMSHWQRLFGDRILDVRYETLVDDQERVSRAIVAHCGLDWTDDCLRFHENRAPTATASAAQVREPLYTSARDLWRKYENQLAPLRKVLQAGGVDL